ncbi:hypothetical protein J437_LFUL001306 [Ladona fulva]|uniref:Uncharacterized protein n=1 Tax=Ladona fulva TaxID=123851 RepID=A0A8K0K004_LADFU|nr:hypothetical protein J437_LFUL001306 [Ladona fulva]
MAGLSMKLFVLAAVVLVALSLFAGAHGQSYGGLASNGGGEEEGDGGGNDKQQGGGGSGGGGGGGGSTDRGPIQFPPAPTGGETSRVVIGGSGFGFVPPQAGGGRGFNLGSRYRGGSSFGGGGGYRSSFGGPRFGGFDGYRGFGGFALRGVSGHGGFFNHW